MTKLEHAFDAIGRGFRVFPQRGKRPAIKRWPYNASAKPSVIERWWARWPDADIGIALDAGVYVIDTDTSTAEAAASVLPRTLTVATARGFHRYFRVPHELARVTPRPSLLCGIEGKGAPGPVTWAGSVHPDGATYALWIDAPIADMPLSLMEAIGPKRETPGAAGEPTDAELSLWRDRFQGVRQASARAQALVVDDARADLRMTIRSLHAELPVMATGWATRFYRAGAYLGTHLVSGGLGYDDVTRELLDTFHELNVDGGDSEHVVRSIARGLAVGARAANLS